MRISVMQTLSSRRREEIGRIFVGMWRVHRNPGTRRNHSINYTVRYTNAKEKIVRYGLLVNGMEGKNG